MPTDELVSARYMTSVRTWCPHGTMEIQGVRRFETGIAHALLASLDEFAV